MGKFATLKPVLALLGFLAAATGGLAGPIHDAARDGNLIRVEQLIGEDPKVVRFRDDHQFTPLHWAAANGHLEVMTFLLEHGAEPDARSDLGMTPLLLVKDGRKDLIVFLVDHGADLRAKGDNGWTALHGAAQNGNVEGAAYLLDQGLDADARCRGPFGTPLTMAAANGRTEVAKLLLAKGADINARTDEGVTPLHDASWRGHAGMVELLLSRKADVNARREKVGVHRT